MINLIIFLILGFITACGRDDSREHKWDPRIIPIIQQFVDDAKRQGISTDLSGLINVQGVPDIMFAANHTAVCERHTDSGTADIWLRSGVFTSTSTLWVSVYHELGHCVLGLDHVEDEDSIMFYKPSLVGPEYYYDRPIKQWAVFLDTLWAAYYQKYNIVPEKLPIEEKGY